MSNPDITIELPQGLDVTVDAASPVDVQVDQGEEVTVEVGTVRGPPGPPGAAQSTYVHNQPLPASVWTIDHNLGFWPDIIVFDTSGREAEGDVLNPTNNRTTVTFSAPFAGTARLS